MVGLGGVLVEVLQDTAIAPAPVTREEALDLIRRLRGRGLFEGVRGMTPRAIGALGDLIAKVSTLAMHLSDVIIEMELNPVLVHSNGEGVTVVDALIVKRMADRLCGAELTPVA